MNITADMILESKVYRAAEEAARQRVVKEWEQCKSEAGREALWHRLQATDAIARELRALQGAEAVERHNKRKD